MSLKPSKETAKAIAGAASAGVAALVFVLADLDLSGADVLYVAGAVVAGYLGTYATPANRDRSLKRVKAKRVK